MKKIIAAFDGLKFSNSTKDYAIFLAKTANAHLVSVFLRDVTYHSYKFSEVLDENGRITEKQKTVLDQKDNDTRKISEEYFENCCQIEGLEHSVHHNKLIPVQELVRESIYSDLLIIDANETFSSSHEEPPTTFIQDLLEEAHCPLLIVPKKFKPIEKIILLYDGKPSSVYAIKMFSYLLPSLKHLPTEIVSVNKPEQSLHLQENKLIKELMKRHFPGAIYSVLKGESASQIFEHIYHQNQNILIVLGAYGRGTVSQWFRESLADTLMKEFKMPLFIAHE